MLRVLIYNCLHLPPHHINLLVSIEGAQLVLLLVKVQHGGGLCVVGGKACAHRLGLVIRALDQVLTSDLRHKKGWGGKRVGERGDVKKWCSGYEKEAC